MMYNEKKVEPSQEVYVDQYITRERDSLHDANSAEIWILADAFASAWNSFTEGPRNNLT